MATEDTQAQDALAATNAAENQVEAKAETEQEQDTAGSQDPAENQDEGASDKPSDEEHDDRPKRPSGTQRLKNRLASLEAELEQYKRQPAQAGDDVAARIRSRIGEPPKESDFNGDYIAYERKLTAYETAEMLARGEVSREIEREKVQADSARREAQFDHEDRVRDAEKRIPDFRQVVSGAKDLWLSDATTELIVNSDKSADLLYAIAKNPGIAEELNALPPLQAARRLGQIEARLTTAQPRKATGAPAPNSAVRGGSAPPSQDQGLDAWLRKQYPHRYK